MHPHQHPDRLACSGPAPYRARRAGLTVGTSVACRWLAATGALLPLPVQAHGWGGGHSPVFSGFMHVITNPAFILPLAALALLAGRGGRRGLMRCQWLVAVGVALGAVAVIAGCAWHGVVIANRVFIILAGLPVAAALPVPGVLVYGMVLCGAMLTGHELLVTDAQAGAVLLFTGGAVLGAMALHGAVGLATLLTDAAWSRVAVRVAGSWIAAIGVIYAGLLLLPHK